MYLVGILKLRNLCCELGPQVLDNGHQLLKLSFEVFSVLLNLCSATLFGVEDDLLLKLDSISLELDHIKIHVINLLAKIIPQLILALLE